MEELHASTISCCAHNQSRQREKKSIHEKVFLERIRALEWNRTKFNFS
jgi:hypothetical protein